MDKIKNDNLLTDEQKEEQLQKLMEDAEPGKKRAKLDDYRDSDNFIHA